MQEPRYLIVRYWDHGIIAEALADGLTLEDGRSFTLEPAESGLHTITPRDPRRWDAYRSIAAAERRAAVEREAEEMYARDLASQEQAADGEELML